MKFPEPRLVFLSTLLAIFCLAAAPGARAQSGEAPPGTQPAPSPASASKVTGTVTRFVNDEIELRTEDGKDQKVGVTESTEKNVEIAKGVAITVEFHRKIGTFILAEKIYAAGQAPAAEPVPAPMVQTYMATGEIVSASDATLVLHTPDGDVTFFLLPSTEYLVKPLVAGLRVTVEYREDKDKSKVAIRVLPAKSDEPETPPPASPPPATPPPTSPPSA